MNDGMEQLDKIMLYGVYPIGLICSIYFTLMGFRIVNVGVPDKGEEAAQEKRLTALRWLGPFAIICILILYLMKWLGVH